MTFASLMGLAYPSMNGLMSRQIPATAQGELQGGVASIYSLTAILGPLVATQLFGYFTSAAAPVYFPGAPFVCSAVLWRCSALCCSFAHDAAMPRRRQSKCPTWTPRASRPSRHELCCVTREDRLFGSCTAALAAATATAPPPRAARPTALWATAARSSSTSPDRPGATWARRAAAASPTTAAPTRPRYAGKCRQRPRRLDHRFAMPTTSSDDRDDSKDVPLHELARLCMGISSYATGSAATVSRCRGRVARACATSGTTVPLQPVERVEPADQLHPSRRTSDTDPARRLRGP